MVVCLSIFYYRILFFYFFPHLFHFLQRIFPFFRFLLCWILTVVIHYVLRCGVWGICRWLYYYKNSCCSLSMLSWICFIHFFISIYKFSLFLCRCCCIPSVHCWFWCFGFVGVRFDRSFRFFVWKFGETEILPVFVFCLHKQTVVQFALNWCQTYNTQ